MRYLLAVHPIVWIALVPVWAFLLRLLSGLFGVDVPSWTRSIVYVILTAAISFFVYDLSGFAFLNMFGERFVDMPQGYGYGRWLGESPVLKWEVLGLVPGIRYIPILMALCTGGTIQVLVLLVPFRSGVPLFATHWGANFGVLALAGFFQVILLGDPGSATPSPTTLKLKSHPDFSPDTFKGVLANLMPKVDLDSKKPVGVDNIDLTKLADAANKKDSKLKSTTKPGNTKTTEVSKEDAKAPANADEPAFAQNLRAVIRELDPHLDGLRHASQPYTTKFPALEKSLNDGGWWGILGTSALLALFWTFSVIARIRGLMTSAGRDVS